MTEFMRLPTLVVVSHLSGRSSIARLEGARVAVLSASTYYVTPVLYDSIYL